MSVVTVAIVAMLSGSLGFLAAAILSGAKHFDEQARIDQATAARRLSVPPSRN